MSMTVSNSEMDTLTKCERMFYYSHGLGIQPKEMSLSLRIGIFGHKLQKAFWRNILAGEQFDKATQEMGQLILESLDEPEVTKILRNALAFVDWAYNEQGWRPVEVEEVHFFRMTDDLDFAMTPDGLFKFSKGINKGRYFVGDFKHVAQYFSENQLVGYQQVPKYVRFLNEYSPYKVTMGCVIMLNTRAPVTHDRNLFTVKWINMNQAKLDRIAVENFRIANHLAALKQLPISQMEESVNRTVNHYTCKLCSFADLCNLDFLGKDSSRLQAVAYEQNEYSYEGMRQDEH